MIFKFLDFKIHVDHINLFNLLMKWNMILSCFPQLLTRYPPLYELSIYRVLQMFDHNYRIFKNLHSCYQMLIVPLNLSGSSFLLIILFPFNNLKKHQIKFLAATSSSRSDVVTKFVRPSVRMYLFFFFGVFEVYSTSLMSISIKECQWE